jgi:hypothetical protein
MSVTDKLGLVRREMLQDQGSEVSIFTEQEQILQMQGIYPVLGVIVDDLVGNEQWFVRVRGAQPIDRETTGQTGDGIE